MSTWVPSINILTDNFSLERVDEKKQQQHSSTEFWKMAAYSRVEFLGRTKVNYWRWMKGSSSIALKLYTRLDDTEKYKSAYL